jgi:hypothetical protein
LGRLSRPEKASTLGIDAVIFPRPAQEIAEIPTIAIEAMVKKRIARGDFTEARVMKR